ncbi:MAG: helix-turn-helix domain-containing protein [Ignavibacteriales bacterium]|nr:helix-turn-helix domain-containing protein [Ignavibacteriales bacterium]
MLEQSQIREILADILESPEFKESQRYRDLLQYLVEESIAGRSPKETTIGIQLFGKDASFNSKEDATVRVYINNLRKKLDHYYLTSEKPHAQKLSIPVGHYKVEFISSAEKVDHPSMRKGTMTYALIALGFIASFTLGYFTSKSPHADAHVGTPPNPLWNDFIKPNGRPTLIVVGDHYFLRERGKTGTYSRITSINSPEDYRQAIATDPEFAKRYEPSDFTYLRPGALYGLTQILSIIRNSPNGYSIKLASQFTIGDFNSNNVIFLGPLKTLFSFQKFVHIFKIEYSVAPPSIRVRGEKGDSLHEFSIGDQRGGMYEKDIAVVAKAAGPEGSTILMLLGFAETGTIEASNAACNNQLFNAIGLKYPLPSLNDPFYFTLIIATEGMTEAIFNTDIRYFVQIKPPLDISDASKKDSSKTK